jgi:hypothetical protein
MNRGGEGGFGKRSCNFVEKRGRPPLGGAKTDGQEPGFRSEKGKPGGSRHAARRDAVTL